MAFTAQAQPVYGPVAGLDAAAQGASISSTNLYGVPSNGAGVYRISIQINIASTGASGTVTATIGWNDGHQTQSQVTSSLSLATNPAQVNLTIEIYAAASTNITALTTWATAGTYDIHIRCEYLG